MDYLKNVNQLVKTFEENKTAFLKECELEFKKCCDFFFRENPKNKHFSWNQYTPYFNDGDACCFGVYSDYITINGFDVDDKDTDSEHDVYVGYRELDWKEAMNTPHVSKDIKKLIDAFPDEMLEQLFGDHTTVTVYRDGIKTVEYDHD